MHGIEKNSHKPELLLHICCGACGAHIASELETEYEVTLLFHNPNVFPEAEYTARLDAVRKVTGQFGLDLIVSDYDHAGWLKAVEGHEHDPEGGARCLICYSRRLEKTAELARDKKIGFFATTLTVSPHKSTQAIIAIGNELAKKYDLKFLAKDFKKQDGFKKASQLSRNLNLYRQNYCGCEFSLQTKK